MEVKEQILSCVAESDLVFVDGCIIGGTDPTGSHRKISEFLYEADDISKLESLTDQVFALHISWRWSLH